MPSSEVWGSAHMDVICVCANKTCASTAALRPDCKAVSVYMNNALPNTCSCCAHAHNKNVSRGWKVKSRKLKANESENLQATNRKHRWTQKGATLGSHFNVQTCFWGCCFCKTAFAFSFSTSTGTLSLANNLAIEVAK